MPDLEWNDRWDKEAARYLDGTGPAVGKPRYGYHWGDPEDPAYSGVVLKRDFLDPYLAAGDVIVEIGPGGGRFTQYLTGASKLYLVDYNEKMFDIIRAEFAPENVAKMTFIKSSGSTLAGVPDASIDKVFTFDCFVHLEIDLIEEYVADMRRVLKSGGLAIVHYADSNKPLAQKLKADGLFVQMFPEDMHRLAATYGFRLVKEDMKSISHSAVIVMEKI